MDQGRRDQPEQSLSLRQLQLLSRLDTLHDAVRDTLTKAGILNRNQMSMDLLQEYDTWEKCHREVFRSVTSGRLQQTDEEEVMAWLGRATLEMIGVIEENNK